MSNWLKEGWCSMVFARRCGAAFLLGLAVFAPGVAFGQGGYNVPRGHSDNPNGPTVSPYLNLLQSNSQGLSNYQTLVKPMIDQQNAIQRQGNSIQRLQQQVSPGSGPGGARGTGHTTRFQNYS